MNSLQPRRDLPDTCFCVKCGLIHLPPPPPEPRHKRGPISTHRTESQYASHIAWKQKERARNIAAGLRYDGKPRKQKWERIIACNQEEHEAIRRERRAECQRRIRAQAKEAALPSQRRLVT